MKPTKIIIALVLIVTLFSPLTAFGENDPRDAIPAPDGTSMFLFYYKHYSGDELYTQGNKVSDDASFDFDLGIFRYAHFVGLGDWTWSYDVLQPVGDMDFGTNNSDGLGDTTFATHINTPVLYKTDSVKYMMSAGFIMSAPTGEYEAAKAVNLGTNRWTYKLEFTPLILQVNKFALEFTGDVKFFTDNDEFGATHANQETDPLVCLQTHLSYNLTDAFWVGLSHYYYTGGESEINGISQNDESANQSLRFSFSFNLASNVVMMLQYDTEIERDNGVKQNYIGTRIAYLF